MQYKQIILILSTYEGNVLNITQAKPHPQSKTLFDYKDCKNMSVISLLSNHSSPLQTGKKKPYWTHMYIHSSCPLCSAVSQY